jgi:hypothetical protein
VKYIFANQYPHYLHIEGNLMFNFVKLFMMLSFIFVVGCASQEPTESDSSVASDTPVTSEQSEDVVANSDSGNDPNEVICRREMVTGSNFRRRVCLTRAQREGLRQGSQDEFNTRRSGTLGGNAPSAPAQ